MNIQRRVYALLLASALLTFNTLAGAQNPVRKKPVSGPNSSPSPALARPQGLTVDNIIAMAQAGLSEEVIVARLRKEDKGFDLTPEDMIRLKKANVSDGVLKVMMDPKAEARPVPVPQPAPNPVIVGCWGATEQKTRLRIRNQWNGKPG